MFIAPRSTAQGHSFISGLLARFNTTQVWSQTHVTATLVWAQWHSHVEERQSVETAGPSVESTQPNQPNQPHTAKPAQHSQTSPTSRCRPMWVKLCRGCAHNEQLSYHSIFVAQKYSVKTIDNTRSAIELYNGKTPQKLWRWQGDECSWHFLPRTQEFKTNHTNKNNSYQ